MSVYDNLDLHFQYLIPTGLDYHTCFYCGEQNSCQDHVPPLSWARKNDLTDVLLLLISACLECNFILGKNHFPTLPKRVAFVKEWLRKNPPPDGDKYPHQIERWKRKLTWEPKYDQMGELIGCREQYLKQRHEDKCRRKDIARARKLVQEQMLAKRQRVYREDGTLIRDVKVVSIEKKKRADGHFERKNKARVEAGLQPHGRATILIAFKDD